MSPEQLLGQMETSNRLVIADMEAGVWNLSRMRASSLDAVLVVVEPSARSIEVARRARDIARERRVGPVRLIANRVRGEDDRLLLERELGPVAWSVPEDMAILDADRAGASVLDAHPDADAVSGIAAMGAWLVGRGTEPAS